MSPAGELEGGSVGPLLLSVTEFGVVELTVDESSRRSLAQLGVLKVCALTVCALFGQVVTLSRLLYTDCKSNNSMLLGVSSVPLDKLPWQ